MTWVWVGVGIAGFLALGAGAFGVFAFLTKDWDEDPHDVSTPGAMGAHGYDPNMPNWVQTDEKAGG